MAFSPLSFRCPIAFRLTGAAQFVQKPLALCCHLLKLDLKLQNLVG